MFTAFTNMFSSSKPSFKYSIANIPQNLQVDLVSWKMDVDTRRITKPKRYANEQNVLELSSGFDRFGKQVSFLELEVPSVSQVDNFFRVASLMKELSRERSILGVKDIACDPNVSAYAIVTDALQGTLSHSFENSAPYNLKKYINQLIKGLEYIHLSGLIHGALTSNNIWIAYPTDLTNQLNLKIGGFSYKSASEVIKQSRQFKNNIPLLAPETINSGICSAASDIFSLGIVLWEIISAESAWLNILGQSSNNITNAKYLTNCFIINNGIHNLLPMPEDAPPGIRYIIQECWKFNPSERPTASEVLEWLRFI